MCYSVAKSETKKQNWLYIYILIFICVIRSTEKVHSLRNLAASYPKKNIIFFYIRFYACLCANDIPKSCKFRFKSGQNSKCKLRFELVTYYLNRGTAVGTASSRALTREKECIYQPQWDGQWPFGLRMQLKKNNWGWDSSSLFSGQCFTVGC